MERNLQDAMQVVRNVIFNPRLVPGGGAFEMALAQMVNEKAKVTPTHTHTHTHTVNKVGRDLINSLIN